MIIFISIVISVLFILMEALFVFGIQDNDFTQIKLGIALDILIYMCIHTLLGYSMLFVLGSFLIPVITMLVAYICTNRRVVNTDKIVNSRSK